jgi:hypothetical protein
MRVVATLTTRAKIHDCLKENLDSLTCQFDEVYLGLPYESHKGEKYPEFEHPKVTIVKLDEDIGPCCKLLGALIKEKRDPNTLIVSVDDDYIYRKDLRSIFEKKRQEDIDKGVNRVMSFSGVYMKYWNFGMYGLNGGWHDNDLFIDWNKEKKLTTIAGYCGCAYPANIFKDVNDYIDFSKKAFEKHDRNFYNDDVVISAYLSFLEVEKVRIEAPENILKGNNNNIGEKLSPEIKELYSTIYSLRDYLEKNNPKKYTLVIIDLIFIIVIILTLFIIYYIYKMK